MDHTKTAPKIDFTPIYVKSVINYPWASSMAMIAYIRKVNLRRLGDARANAKNLWDDVSTPVDTDMVPQN